MAAVLAVTVCACARDRAKKPEENIYPADYKVQIVAQVRGQLDDPKDIRDALVAEPVLKASLVTPRYIACVRFNAKDRSGAYKGSKDMAAYFYEGKITQVVDASLELCGNAAFQPFPELQRP
jgi:hypothetical protein